MVYTSYRLMVPTEVVEGGLEELGQSVRATIETGMRELRARRMPAHDLKLLLQSVAWQSPTLKRYFAYDRRLSESDEDMQFELLSDEDMLELGCPEVCAKAPTTESSPKAPTMGEHECSWTTSGDEFGLLAPLHQPQGPTATSSHNMSARKLGRLKHVRSLNNFDHLTLSEADNTMGADDMPDIEEAFAPLGISGRVGSNLSLYRNNSVASFCCSSDDEDSGSRLHDGEESRHERKHSFVAASG
jgi:hypothetical protein